MTISLTDLGFGSRISHIVPQWDGSAGSWTAAKWHSKSLQH